MRCFPIQTQQTPERYYLSSLKHGFLPAGEMLNVLLESEEAKSDALPEWLQ